MAWRVDAGSRKKMASAQFQCKEDSDKRDRSSRENIDRGSLVFMRKEFYGAQDRKHKLAPVTSSPFQVVPAADITVIVQTDGKQKTLS